MEALGGVLFIVGAILSGIGGLWLLVVAFQESVLWGLACWFIPFVALYFVATHWEETKTPFLMNLGGVLVAIVGMVMSGGGG